jgi:ribosomal-protein-alanine N-acetyltransferase
VTADAHSAESEVVIRPLEVHEFDAISELDTDVFGRWAYPCFVLRQLFDAHRRFWLVAEGPTGYLRGYTLAVHCSDTANGPDPGAPSAWLFGLGVRKQYMRMGCGRLLTAAVLELLAGSGVQLVKLTVEPENGTAIALYEEFGFVPVRYGEHYFGRGDHRIVMEAQLADFDVRQPDCAAVALRA